MKKYIYIASFALLTIVGISSVVSAQTYTFNNDLSLGARGGDVEQLQTWLINNGYDIPSVSSGAVGKGYFGGQTQGALISYQRSIGLPAYGFFGPMTRQYFNRGGGNDNNNNYAAAFNIVSPNGGESWQKGTTQTIRWNSPAFIRATYVDIKLVPDNTCRAQVCTMQYRMPYTIATNVSIDQRAYNWTVGKVNIFNDTFYVDINEITTAPDGQYTIQICQTGTSVCTSSRSLFNIYSSNQGSSQPIISGIDAPTSLSVGQTGTWTVRARDPLNGNLNYSVTWGDEARNLMTNGLSVASPMMQQATTFTHSYASAGTYTVTFTVRNSSGLQAQTSSTVTVIGSGTQTPMLTVTSPNGGEVWNVGENRSISWNTIYPTGVSGLQLPIAQAYSMVDIYLVSSGCSYPMTCMIQPQLIAKNVQGSSYTGTYTWAVGTLMANTGVTGAYKIQVCQAGAMSVCDASDNQFTINSSSNSSAPDINVISPNGNETWRVGTSQYFSVNITGDTSRIGNNIVTYLVNVNGQQTYLGNYSNANTAGVKSFNLTVPTNVPSGTYKLFVNLYQNSQLQAYDYSDLYFSVLNNDNYFSDHNQCPAGYVCTLNGY